MVDEWEGCQCGVNANGGWFGREGVLGERVYAHDRKAAWSGVAWFWVVWGGDGLGAWSGDGRRVGCVEWGGRGRGGKGVKPGGQRSCGHGLPACPLQRSVGGAKAARKASSASIGSSSVMIRDSRGATRGR